jgi:hypothetical protein
MEPGKNLLMLLFWLRYYSFSQQSDSKHSSKFNRWSNKSVSTRRGNWIIEHITTETTPVWFPFNL